MQKTVQILTARAHRLFTPVLERIGALAERGENTLVLVPEQFTLSAEREIMRRLKLEGMFMIDVLSPSRLYSHIQDTAGRDGREPLTDAGCLIAFSQAVEKLDGKLPYYGSMTQRRGFLEKLHVLIRDLKRGGLTPELLAEEAGRTRNPVLAHKLTDLSAIYGEYERILGGRFSDSADAMAYIAGRTAQSTFLKGKHLFVYGFDTLTLQLMHLLKSAAGQCAGVTAALVCDGENAPDGDLYEPIRQDIGRFREMLKKEDILLREEHVGGETLEHCEAANHLDRIMYTRTSPALPGLMDSIRFCESAGPYEEASAAASSIRELLKNGTEAEKIALLYPDSSSYYFAVTAALTDAGIPFYTDRPLPALTHGLIRFLLYALRAVSGRWQTADMDGLLRSGYAPLTFRECCDLGAYAQEFRIRGKLWTQPFSRGPQKRILNAEPLRQKLMTPLEALHDDLVKAGSAAESMAAVFTLLESVNAWQNLRDEEAYLLENGFASRAGQNSQIWQAILTLADQMVRIAPEKPVALKHIATRMECGFSAISLRSLPPARGMLHAGVLGHALQESADAVFILGMTDDLLSRSTDSLLTESEKAQTEADTGAWLGLTDESRSRLACLDLKRAMTLPEKTLYLSWSRSDATGQALSPLPLVKLLFESFPEVSLSAARREPEELSGVQAYDRLAGLIRDYMDGTGKAPEDEMRRLAARCASLHPERLVNAAADNGTASRIPPSTASQLYRNDALSVSRLESFANCPFRHFVQYGLRPALPDSWEVNRSSLGTLYHDVMKCFADKLLKEPGFPEIPDERIGTLTEEAISELRQEALNGPLGDSDRTMARFERAREILARATLTMTHQLAAGSFRLYMTEAAFGEEGGLPPIRLVLKDGREFDLKGRIDRVDLLDTGESVYLRVVDYKSGNQSLNAGRIWAGLQLQLLMYLEVCTQLFGNGKPAGAFYFYLSDPLIDTASAAKEKVEEELCKLLRLRGVVLDEVGISDAMDSSAERVVLPPPGTNSKELSTLSGEQFETLLSIVREKAVSLTEEMMDGRNEISPAKADEYSSACSFCDFRSVCRFDPAQPEHSYRAIPNVNARDFLKKLDEARSERQQTAGENPESRPES